MDHKFWIFLIFYDFEFLIRTIIKKKSDIIYVKIVINCIIRKIYSHKRDVYSTPSIFPTFYRTFLPWLIFPKAGFAVRIEVKTGSTFIASQGRTGKRQTEWRIMPVPVVLPNARIPRPNLNFWRLIPFCLSSKYIIDAFISAWRKNLRTSPAALWKPPVPVPSYATTTVSF